MNRLEVLRLLLDLLKRVGHGEVWITQYKLVQEIQEQIELEESTRVERSKNAAFEIEGEPPRVKTAGAAYEVGRGGAMTPLDEHIAPIVQLLNRLGFQTSGSCEGGPGHAFSIATVQLPVSRGTCIDQYRREVVERLVDIGMEGFTAKSVCLHQRTAEAMPESFVELEFWSLQDALAVAHSCLDSSDSP